MDGVGIEEEIHQPPQREDDGRKRNRNGDIIDSVVGVHHRIYRMLDPELDDGKHCCRHRVGAGRNKELDSYVSRCQREKGFQQTSCRDEEREVEEYEALQRAIDETNALERKPNSSVTRVNFMSHFECYVLHKHPNTEFGKFLANIKEPGLCPAGISFVQPHRSTVLAFVKHQRENRKNKFNSIRCFLCALSMTSIDCGQGKFVYGPAIDELLDTYKEEDEESRAPAFHPEEALLLLWAAVWEKSALSYYKKVCMWTRILVQLGTISRSSDLCWEKGRTYCPKVKVSNATKSVDCLPSNDASTHCCANCAHEGNSYPPLTF